MRKMVDRPASIQPLKSKLRLSVLDDNDIEMIDQAALIILDEVGVYMPSEKVLKVMDQVGCEVDFEKKNVRIPADVVKKYMATAPRHFNLSGRERPELDVKLDGKSGTYCNNGGTAAFAVDFETRTVRSSCKQDVINSAIIVDYMSIISICWPNVAAAGAKQNPMLHELDASFNNTEKHVMSASILGDAGVKYALEMAAIVAGGMDNLKARPFLSALTCDISPLAHDKGGLETIIGFANAGMPTGHMAMPIMGTTAPASQAGTLAQGLAEVLSTMVLAQIINPGCPCFMSIIPAIIDPRSGDYVYSSTSAQIANAAAVQLAHYYGVPAYQGASYGGSCYELNRWQVGKENVYLPLLATLAGADMCFSISLIGDDNIWHPARICFDREINRAINIIGQGVEVNGDTLAFDTIRKVGPRGHYLDREHTVNNLPKLWDFSFLFQKSENEETKWKDLEELAWEEIRWIINNHKVPELDPKVQAELKQIIQAGEKELLLG
jgi:trimethylamine--corrinoid protein Co-methyltransferase